MENENVDVFKTPFNKVYWQMSCMELKSVRKMCIISLIIALRIVCQATSIPIVKGYLEIQFDFVPSMIGGLLFGPVVAIISGFVADNVGFLLNPGSVYNACYTISAIASGLIYALFLYRQKVTVWRIFLSKLIVNIFVNAFMGTYWIYLFYNTKGKGYLILLGTRLMKNLISLPIEVIVMVILIGLLMPFFKSRHLVSNEQPDKIKWF